MQIRPVILNESDLKRCVELFRTGTISNIRPGVEAEVNAAPEILTQAFLSKAQGFWNVVKDPLYLVQPGVIDIELKLEGF